MLARSERPQFDDVCTKPRAFPAELDVDGNRLDAATPTRTPTPIPPALPAASSGLAATPVSRNRIDLAWQDKSSNETGFQIERARNGNPFSLIVTTAAGATSYSDTSGLTPGKLYSYRVRAVNAAGTSGYSNTASATAPKK
ncbi:MAG TPA: fibronectin type III domain-containing protein [Thermoanaerobaculia bacterium]|nr:fibronectin type III domain-containing protein [Thermoanaerobaculia bacterium]